MLEVFRNRDDPEVREAYILGKEEEAAERRKNKNKNKPKRKPRAKKRNDLILLEAPETITAGKPLVVKVRHTVNVDLGEQPLHVTFKAGPEGARVDRQIVKIQGTGVAEVTSDVPDPVPGGVVHFAAFVGEDYQSNLQHVQIGPLPTR